MPVIYTHTFEIKTSSRTISGEIEFNEDGVMSYKINAPHAGVTLAQSRAVDSLFEHSKQIFDNFGGITKIEIVEK